MTHLDVRRAVPADATVARDVIERAIRISAASCYPAEAVDAWARGGSLKGVHRMIEETCGFVAVLDGAVVGWANLDGKEVDQLYVDPIAGGSGVARRLYEAVEQLARAEGLAELTAVASLRAAPAFRRFGFHDVVEGERSFNGHTFVVLHMTKRLSD
jgi:putative acetyltransferase